MKAKVKVDDEKVRRHLDASRKQISQGVKEGLNRAAEKHGLPRARALAPGSNIRTALTAGATTRTAYIQVDLRRAPEAGLLEFGGTVRTVIHPKHAEALSTPEGPRAAVKNPRTYKAKRYMQKAVRQTLPAVLMDAQKAIAEAFESVGLKVD